MKRIEVIKTIVLILLVALSITLTFSIWTYTPKYPTIEQQPTVDISISKKSDITDVIKPYKLLFNFEEGLKGTADPVEIDEVVGGLKSWKISELKLVDRNFDEKKLARFVRKKNRMSMLFPAEVPLPVYSNVLNFEGLNIPETTFDRIVVEWNSMSTAINMYFISRENKLLYEAKANVVDVQNFQQSILTRGNSYGGYAEIDPENTPYIAVPVDKIELLRNTYSQGEISPSRFRDALFRDPNAVKRSQVEANSNEFQDDRAIMTINTLTKDLDYVHPTEKSKELAIPSELLFNTFDFINEHGGWTDDFRYSHIDPLSRYVEFQLYVHGLPVFSDTTSTKMEQTWGEDRIYRYMRPYYTLDSSLPSETEVKVLPSGLKVGETLLGSKEIDFSLVEEIIPGYYMKHDREHNLFMLEPSWYYSINDNWIRFSPEQFGGETIGLE